MPDLTDASQYSSWPPQGGRLDSLSADTVRSSPAAEVSINSVVASAVSHVDDLGLHGASHSGEVPTAANIWRHHNAHPLVLLLMALDSYGDELLEWDPDVLKVSLQRDGKALSNVAWTRLLAARALLSSPAPWRQWNVFHWVTRALSGEAPNFVYMERPELGQIVAGYDIMRIVDPHRETSHDVDKFVAAALIDVGSPFAPAPLGFADHELSAVQLQCLQCHSTGRDDNDTRCVTCGSTELQRTESPWQAQRQECDVLWRDLHQLPLTESLNRLPDTAAGSVLHALLVDWDYARDQRVRLVQQLKMLGAHA